MDKFEVQFVFKDIFSEDQPSDSFDLLKKYSTKNILIKLAHINAILFNRRADDDIQIFSKVLFGGQDLPKSFVNTLNLKLKQGTFFGPQSISLLIKQTLNNYSEHHPENIPYVEFAIDLFKTILIYNELFLNLIDKEDDLKDFKSLFKLDLMQQTYIRPIRFTNYLMRSAFMCHFLNQDVELKPFTIQFCQHYGMSDPWKISKFLIELLNDNGRKKATFGLTRSQIPPNLLEDWIININDLEPKELSLNFDIIPKPLFQIDENEFIILDLSFFQYMVDQGFFYNIFRTSIATSTSKLNSFNNFKSYIGKKYFEDYLCKMFLEKTFYRRDQLVVSNEKYQDFIVKTTSDNLLVIEAKMLDINARVVEHLDFDAFKNNIDDNLLSNKANGKKNKGAFQIIDQIRQLADPANASELHEIFNVKKVKNLNIYPILLVSDTNYSISGTNKYITSQSNREIYNLALNFKSIRPIIIININVFLEYFPYFKQNKSNFTDLIKGYFAELNKWEKSFNKHADIYSYYQCSIPFDKYLRKKLKGKTIVENFDIFEENFGQELGKINFSPDPSN
ncbi:MULTISPECIES: hypothetical protein [Sphingobacterium]|uniref:hypothetical protein n=1 Tax=Sphingobacterium TaxID=28453 RepID=UPI00257A9BA8|nr:MULTISPECIES: hypothetical protein [Sphingobacterium]